MLAPLLSRPEQPEAGNFPPAAEVSQQDAADPKDSEQSCSERDFARLARHWRQLFGEADCLTDPGKRRTLLHLRSEYQRLQLALADGEPRWRPRP